VSSADLAARVAANPPVGDFEPDFDHARPSAVLVVLADGPHGAEVLLTRRSMQLSNHRGEISFPGGRLDPGETYEQAALREADEEVGLMPSTVTVAGRLQPIGTYVSRSWIVPVVAQVAERFELHGHPDEVDRVMWVPLRDLTRPGTFREEWWHTVQGERPIFFFELDDETVWGATARMLHQLLRVAHGIEGPEPPAL
jgi:8-oxo-dGTP pyrophosphatase MutT (NUDIX family)